eukprot:4700707-Prymnesium_polylepis.1
MRVRRSQLEEREVDEHPSDDDAAHVDAITPVTRRQLAIVQHAAHSSAARERKSKRTDRGSLCPPRVPMLADRRDEAAHVLPARRRAEGANVSGGAQQRAEGGSPLCEIARPCLQTAARERQ